MTFSFTLIYWYIRCIFENGNRRLNGIKLTNTYIPGQVISFLVVLRIFKV